MVDEDVVKGLGEPANQTQPVVHSLGIERQAPPKPRGRVDLLGAHTVLRLARGDL
jgi:hypothetical protein